MNELYKTYQNNRYKKFNMPKVNLVDMLKETHKNQIPIISKELKLEIQNTLNKKEQIILLQNRRSYSYIIQCSNCKTTIECKNCRVSLKYHKDENVYMFLDVFNSKLKVILA